MRNVSVPEAFVVRLFGRTRKLSMRNVAGPGPDRVVLAGVVTVYVEFGGPPVKVNSPLEHGSTIKVFPLLLHVPSLRIFIRTLSVKLSMAMVPKLKACVCVIV